MLGSAIKDAAERYKINVLAPSREELNLENFQEIKRFLEVNQISKVIHCAAMVGGIKFNQEFGADLLVRNIQIDSNTFRACTEAGIKELLYMSSSCTFPLDAPQPFTEVSARFGEFEPTNRGYAIAKVVGVESLISINKQYGTSFRSLILSNLYGPMDNFVEDSSHLISAAILKCHKARQERQSTVEIWGTGRPRREFTYVFDVAEWIVSQSRNIAKLPEIMNLGCGEDKSILEFYETAARAVGFNGEFIFNQSMPDGISSKLMDSTVARENYSWRAKTDIELGMKKTYEWWLSQNKELI